MRKQVEAIQCGHWTEINEDGSVPLRCDYCFMEGLNDFRQRMAEGDVTFSPEMIDGLGKAIECLGVKGEALDEIKECLRELEQPEGE